MSLLDDILAWANAELTLWQRDAVRRLFQKQDLGSQDYDDLYAMLKSAHGLPDPQKRQPVPLAQEHLPAHTGSTTPVILRDMRDLKHVNRIAPGQKLEFTPTGITVIYGGTGSGKSGYSRVLKRACRARDVSETVHPDAFDPKAAANVPEAIFDVEVGGWAKSLVWKRDIAPPHELSTIAVFDARCARAYLDTEQEVAYVPYGLDIVENLGQRVLSELTQRLNTEVSRIDTDTMPFADLLGDTAVGTMIASLSPTTDSQKLTALATITGEETSRLADLDKALAESDPKSKAKALRLSAQRIDTLASRIEVAVNMVNDAALEKVKFLDNEAETAAQGEIVAAANFRAGEQLLPGTGEQVWKNLFEEARRFSTQVAYPGKSFPNVDAGAQCLLCQQPLDKIAAGRMQRFEEFVKQQTAKVAAEKRKQRQEAVQKLERASLGFGLDAATTAELEQLDVTQLRAAQEFEKKIEDRRRWTLSALEAHSWDGAPTLHTDPRPGLKSLSTKLLGQAADLDKAADEKQKKALEVERAQLRSRASLAPRLQSVLDLVERMRLKAKLAECKDDLKTKAISDKAREFANKAVTAALKGALDAEFQALGVGHTS